LLATTIGLALTAGGFVTWYVNAALQGAMKVQCLSIVEGIVTSLEMYGEDYGRLPPAGGQELLSAHPRHRGVAPGYVGGENYGFAGGEPESGGRESPLVMWVARNAVIRGTAGISWNPRAKQPNNGKGQALPNH
jgi:hypothetical protein